jgi:uroporphyrinogen-III decarboxylase
MAGQTSKELFTNVFQMKSLTRLPFIPWISTFAAKLEQIPVQKMFSDATSLSRSLQNAQKLFGYDGITIVFDPTLEAEACGCEIKWSDAEELPVVICHPFGEGAEIEDFDVSEIEKKGRIPVALETAKRMSILKGREIALIAVITGPVTLAGLLRGDRFIPELENPSQETLDLIELAQKVNLKLCNAYCKQGVDAVVIAEKWLGKLRPDLIHAMIAPVFQTLWNVTKYYNAYSLILTRDCSDEHVEPIFQLQTDGLVISGNIDYEHILGAAVKYNRCFGINIPSSALLGTQAELNEVLRRCPTTQERRGFFLSTEWEVPYDTPVTNLHEIMRSIKAKGG